MNFKGDQGRLNFCWMMHSTAPLDDYSDVTQLSNLTDLFSLSDLKKENKELKNYVDRLLLYLMEKYPEALESRRLYR